MWDKLPAPIRRLFGLPELWRPAGKPAGSTAEGLISYTLLSNLGLDSATAYGLLERGPLPPRFRYRHWSIPKKDGNLREIAEPGPALKAAQQRILAKLLKKARPHQAALGFRRGCSIVDHASAHAGATTIITADIQDFFPSTGYGRVRRWWEKRGYAPVDARLLTTLTTYRGALPQGAPTSPLLSNLVNWELDAAIDRFVRVSGGTYTRYADDLAFSWAGGGSPPLTLEAFVRARLREAGYTLHERKGWHVWRRKDEPEVTGLVLARDGAVELPQAMRSLIRALDRSDDPGDRRRLQGLRGFESMVREQQGRELAFRQAQPRQQAPAAQRRSALADAGEAEAGWREDWDEDDDE